MKNELVVVKVNDITIEVQPDVEHDWLLSTKDVAEGYGLSESGLRSAKSANLDELEEGKHFINVRNTDVGGKPRVMWTKRGVVRLGFFIKTSMAKDFRDWAEDYIISDRALHVSTPAIPQNFSDALKLAYEQSLQIEQLSLENTVMKPKVEYYDEFLDGDGCCSLKYPAILYGYKPLYFPEFLRSKGLIQKFVRTTTTKGRQTGWFKDSPDESYPNIKITPKGLVAIKELMSEYEQWAIRNKRYVNNQVREKRK